MARPGATARASPCWTAPPRLPTRAAPGKLKLSDQQFTFEPYALALARGDDDFRLLIDRTLAQTYRSGRIDVVFKSAFGDNANPTPALRALYLINGLVE